jgi:serine/threonine-protein kinase
MPALSLWDGKPLWEGYHLRRRRGQGAFGQVWEAETATGELVAMKFLPCTDGSSVPREMRNIQAIRHLEHFNLLRTERVWASQGFLVVCMELADGSLADLLEICRAEYGTGMPRDVVADYLTQAARALDFLNAHRHVLDGKMVGIQHGDVKPGNLLVVGQMLKLGDFGLATQMSAPMVRQQCAGTPGYAAPEVFEGRLSDWTDQYALAVTYCQLRGGRLPWSRRSARLPRSEGCSKPDLSMLTADEARVIERALVHTPQDRWRSCGELMTQLRRPAAM